MRLATVAVAFIAIVKVSSDPVPLGKGGEQECIIQAVSAPVPDA